MPLLSIIVPVYNVEAYLPACLDSIRSQTFPDFEVLCVNDGSTDGSARIARDFAAQDDRFVCVDKENGGYGSAMNCGLERARGDYIGIVEPDDWIDAGMYASLVDHIFFGNDTPADVVKGSYFAHSEGENGAAGVDETPRINEFMPAEACTYTIAEIQDPLCSHPSIWSGIYRRAYLEREGVRFVEAPGAGWVDNPFLYAALVPARKIVWTPQAFYHYRTDNPEASSAKPDYRMVFDRMRDIRSYLHGRKTPTHVWDVFYRHEFNNLHTLEIAGYSLDEPEMRPLITEMLSDMDQAIMQRGRFSTDYNIELFTRFVPLEMLPLPTRVRMRLYRERLEKKRQR